MAIPRTRTRGPINYPESVIGYTSDLAFPNCYYLAPRVTKFPSGRPSMYEVCHDWLHPGPPYKEGGPLFLKKLTATYYPSQSVSVENYPWTKYEGHFSITNAIPTVVMDVYNGYGETAGSFGSQAIRKFRPAKPGGNAGQWLAELRDFPGMLKWKIKAFKDLGGSYLNYEFGWRPFLKDILDFIKFQDKIEKRIAHIRKYNGKWHKRAGTLKDETTTTSSDLGNILTPSLTYYFWRSPGTTPSGRRTVVTTDKIWFEGSMKFYIDDLHVDSCRTVWSSKLRRKLLGLDISPSLLWELLPYTWLQNWALNYGDLIYNLSETAYDNLAFKYAYVMRHRSYTVIDYCGGTLCDGPIQCANGRYQGYGPLQAGPSVHAMAKYRAECKERANASMWGIGNVGDGGLSPRQLAILFALGLSKIT